MATEGDVFDVFMRGDTEPDPEPVKALTVRLPAGLFQWVSVMADEADRSKNQLAISLIQWGVSAALARLPDDIRNDLEQQMVDWKEQQ
jgi:hypothetical protein